MDWLLIGDIPANRIGCNTPGDVSAYMEGNHNTYGQSQRCWTPSTYVDGPAFDTLMGFSTREWGKPGSQGGYLSRVFGRGSESGLADGFLSPHSSVFYDPEYGSYDAWAFSPRYQYGLGDSGDSGTWIFTAEGKLLGQIISYNRARHITYYTPICKIFNHIKRVTGATEVELLLPDDVPGRSLPPLKSAYGLLSPAGISPNADGPSTRTASEDPLSKDSSQAKPVITPPRSPHSERLAPLNMRSSRTLFGEKALELVPAQSDGWTFDSTMLRTFDDVQSLGNPYPW